MTTHTSVTVEPLLGPGVHGAENDPPFWHFDIPEDQFPEFIADAASYVEGLGLPRSLAREVRLSRWDEAYSEEEHAWVPRGEGAQAAKATSGSANARPIKAFCCVASDGGTTCHAHC